MDDNSIYWEEKGRNASFPNRMDGASGAGISDADIDSIAPVALESKNTANTKNILSELNEFMDGNPEIPGGENIASFVHTMLGEIESRFKSMSDSILSRLDDMTGRITELEGALCDILTEATKVDGVATEPGPSDKKY